MRYALLIVFFVASLFLGWYISATFLDDIIMRVFQPQTHEYHIDIWFSVFIFIEVLISLLFGFLFYKKYRAKNHI